MVRELRRLDLQGKKSGEKFIPDLYKYNSVSVRVALLQGLLDTDGYISKDGMTIEHYTVSKRLNKDVCELLQSLGCTTKVKVKKTSYKKNGTKFNCQDCYVTTFRYHNWLIPFRLKRKADRWKPRTKYKPIRYFDSIMPIGKKEAVCIKVEAEDSLYLTRNFIVTHNTEQAISSLLLDNTLPGLIVVEPKLIPQWRRRIEKFSNLRVHAINTGKVENIPECDVVLIGYTNVSKWQDYFLEYGFKALVMDEVQEIRRDESLKHQACSKIADACDYVIGLSGTPIFNYGIEAFNILSVIKPGILGTREQFRREWCGMSDSVSDPEALGGYLRDMNAIVRRDYRDVKKELPELNKVVQTVGFDREKLDEVNDVAKSLAMQVLEGSYVERGKAARDLSILMRQQTGISKARYVAEFAKMLLQKENKIIISGWHRTVYDIWLEELAEFNPVMYTGSETTAKKDQNKDKFCRGDSRVMIISNRSGAGLDELQYHCNNIIIGELDWTGAVLDQLICRLYRTGQKKEVNAYYLVSDSGSDPAVMDIMGLKKSQFDGIIDPGKEPELKKSDNSIIKELARRMVEENNS